MSSRRTARGGVGTELLGFSNGGAVQNSTAVNGFNGTSNGNGHAAPTQSSRALKSNLQPTDPSELHDLVCVGFGPASLAVAVAMHDNLAAGNPLVPNATEKPKVLFLEKQPRFAWHAGMLLPGAKMQISFIKDMATLRDPRSHFTFLNYLHHAGRLVEFTNLGTFLPSRVEYEDYLRWCASHFDDVVQYQREVVSVSPNPQSEGAVKTFTVKSRNAKTGQVTTVQARNVLIAAGGRPLIPKSLPAASPKVIHSSQYAHQVPKILKNTQAPYRVAVVGAGQSAAEIFNNVQKLVNSIFNPSYTDSLPRSQQYRRALIKDAKATNYGVVRLELIEHLRSHGNHESDRLQLHVRRVEDSFNQSGITDEFLEQGPSSEEILDVDLIIAATGYQRNAHVDMLRDSWNLLPETQPVSSGRVSRSTDGRSEGNVDSGSRKLEVGRDYKVRYAPGAIAPDAGVWLQGCCEATHGLSDSLLSVLAVRSGEIVDSIFPSPSKSETSSV
ncbi:L-ornithine 5-monooxygenase [Verticillium dahliae]|nr:L-ornithine 5-monooxygenase [Verticillium dahliae]